MDLVDRDGQAPAGIPAGHRPWPPPARRWRWRQTWQDLLFIHWPVPADALRPLIPSPLAIDTRGGAAWLGLVPFRMTGVTYRGLPAVPWLSAFAEMNLRTYVTLDGKPGVWFLRMDAARALAVWAARLGMGLPYVWSTMYVRRDGDEVSYSSVRAAARFEATYRPVGPPAEASAGSLEAFLTERYCLYTVRARRLLRVEVHHRPWPLQPARAEIRHNTIQHSMGLPGPIADPLLHFADRLDVVGWGPEAVR